MITDEQVLTLLNAFHGETITDLSVYTSQVTEAARAALEAYEQSKWCDDMSKAPINTFVLGYCPNPYGRDVEDKPNSMYYRGGIEKVHFQKSDTGLKCYSNTTQRRYPTHWQHLPASPKYGTEFERVIEEGFIEVQANYEEAVRKGIIGVAKNTQKESGNV